MLSNDLTFGNIEHFFNIMKPEEQEAVCRRISEATGRLGDKTLGYFSPVEARKSLDVIVKVRNMCAHDERLYCARIGKRRQTPYTHFLMYAQRYLPESDYSAFLGSVIDTVQKYSDKSELVYHVLKEMGFTGLEGRQGSE